MEEVVVRVMLLYGQHKTKQDFENALYYRVKKYDMDRFYNTCFDSCRWYSFSDEEKTKLEKKGIENTYDYLEHLCNMRSIAYEKQEITEIVIE